VAWLSQTHQEFFLYVLTSRDNNGPSSENPDCFTIYCYHKSLSLGLDIIIYLVNCVQDAVFIFMAGMDFV
jgi:hypothetical protein